MFGYNKRIKELELKNRDYEFMIRELERELKKLVESHQRFKSIIESLIGYDLNVDTIGVSFTSLMTDTKVKNRHNIKEKIDAICNYLGITIEASDREREVKAIKITEYNK